MRLKDLREDADVKQKNLAEYLHIKQNKYSQYENEQRQLPIEFLIALQNITMYQQTAFLGISNKK